MADQDQNQNDEADARWVDPLNMDIDDILEDPAWNFPAANPTDQVESSSASQIPDTATGVSTQAGAFQEFSGVAHNAPGQQGQSMEQSNNVRSQFQEDHPQGVHPLEEPTVFHPAQDQEGSNTRLAQCAQELDILNEEYTEFPQRLPMLSGAMGNETSSQPAQQQQMENLPTQTQTQPDGDQAHILSEPTEHQQMAANSPSVAQQQQGQAQGGHQSPQVQQDQHKAQTGNQSSVIKPVRRPDPPSPSPSRPAKRVRREEPQSTPLPSFNQAVRPPESPISFQPASNRSFRHPEEVRYLQDDSQSNQPQTARPSSSQAPEVTARGSFEGQQGFTAAPTTPSAAARNRVGQSQGHQTGLTNKASGSHQTGRTNQTTRARQRKPKANIWQQHPSRSPKPKANIWQQPPSRSRRATESNQPAQVADRNIAFQPLQAQPGHFVPLYAPEVPGQVQPRGVENRRSGPAQGQSHGLSAAPGQQDSLTGQKRKRAASDSQPSQPPAQFGARPGQGIQQRQPLGNVETQPGERPIPPPFFSEVPPYGPIDPLYAYPPPQFRPQGMDPEVLQLAQASQQLQWQVNQRRLALQSTQEPQPTQTLHRQQSSQQMPALQSPQVLQQGQGQVMQSQLHENSQQTPIPQPSPVLPSTHIAQPEQVVQVGLQQYLTVAQLQSWAVQQRGHEHGGEAALFAQAHPYPTQHQQAVPPGYIPQGQHDDTERIGDGRTGYVVQPQAWTAQGAQVHAQIPGAVGSQYPIQQSLEHRPEVQMEAERNIEPGQPSPQADTADQRRRVSFQRPMGTTQQDSVSPRDEPPVSKAQAHHNTQAHQSEPQSHRQQVAQRRAFNLLQQRRQMLLFQAQFGHASRAPTGQSQGRAAPSVSPPTQHQNSRPGYPIPPPGVIMTNFPDVSGAKLASNAAHFGAWMKREGRPPGQLFVEAAGWRFDWELSVTARHKRGRQSGDENGDGAGGVWE